MKWFERFLEKVTADAEHEIGEHIYWNEIESINKVPTDFELDYDIGKYTMQIFFDLKNPTRVYIQDFTDIEYSMRDDIPMPNVIDKIIDAVDAMKPWEYANKRRQEDKEDRRWECYY